MLTDLAVTPIAETIRRVSAERRSGDLHVRSARAAKVVCFDHGRIVFAASNLKKERLGEGLVSIGRITDAEFERASGLMKKDRGLRFGDALVAAGVMDEDGVGSSVAHWVEQIVLSVFPLAGGVAQFDERPCSVPLEYMVGLSVHRILYSGIKRVEKQELVQAGLGNLDRRVRMAGIPPFDFVVQQCSPAEIEVLGRSKGGQSVRRLAWSGKALSFEHLRAAYALLASGVLEDEGAKREPQPVIETETGTFLLSSLDRKAPVVTEARRPKTSSAAPAAPVRPSASAAPAPAAAPPASPAAAPAPSPPSAAPPSAAPAPPPPAPALPDMEVDRLLTQANVDMMVSNVSGAIKTYARLVELQPEVLAHRVRLATLMARLPQTARQAERHFVEAIRLAPDDPDLHFRFGQYYQAMNVRSRAIAEFRTVLRLDPRHEEARAALVAESPRDSVLGGLKKLLG